MPSNPEAGYGAVTEDGVIVLNEPVVRSLGLTRHEIESHAREVRVEIRRRLAAYRGEAPFPAVAGRTVIVVDDGLASGYTMLAAVESVRRRGPERVVVAVPVASAASFEAVKPQADDTVSLVVADTDWFAVASYYHDFYNLSDFEVVAYLSTWRRRKSEEVVGRR
jgi:putative phosphoribosyl transferase